MSGVEQWRPLADKYGQKYGVDPNFLLAVMHQESGGNRWARSSAGAQGLMQFMPGTARSYGVGDPFNAEQSIQGGAKMLGSLLKSYKGDVSKTLAAYNAGPGAVAKYNGIPPYAQTQNYVKSIMGNYSGPGVIGPGMSSSAPAASGAPASTLSIPPMAGGVNPAALGHAEAFNLLSRVTKDAALQNVLGGMAQQSMMSGMQQLPPPTGAAPPTSPNSGPPGSYAPPTKFGKGLTGVLGFGGEWGLKLPPPGSAQYIAQTTGGGHAQNSLHYADRAADFGDALNAPSHLKQVASYLLAHPQGVAEMFYGPMNAYIKNGRVQPWNSGMSGIKQEHMNHLHLAF